MKQTIQLLIFAGLALMLSQCGDKQAPEYGGPAYPYSSDTAILFQAEQAEASCRVFAELFAFFPPGLSGTQIKTALIEEGRAKGADAIVVGQSRESQKDEGAYYYYFGPVKEYLPAESGIDWSFGYPLWKKQLSWLSIGYSELESDQLRLETPVTMQLVMLRCQ